MKIFEEKRVRDFEFWSGAVDTAEKVEEADRWDEVEAELDELYPDGMEDTELNDLFWFDSDFIFQIAGIDPYGELEDEEEE